MINFRTLDWDRKSKEYHLMIKEFVNEKGIYKDTYLPRLKSFIHYYKKNGLVLDLGCGEGTVTQVMSSWGYGMSGIDSSKKMIMLARKYYPNIDFKVCLGEKASSLQKKFDVVVSNMALHDMKDLDQVVKNANKILKKNGGFVFSIAHPCFFTKESQDYFQGNEKYLRLNKYKNVTRFKKVIPGNIVVSHYHRSLKDYFHSFHKNGFEMVDMDEIFDDKKSIFFEIPMCLMMSFKKK